MSRTACCFRRCFRPRANSIPLPPVKRAAEVAPCLKVKPGSCLECPMVVRLRLNQTERIRAVDAEGRSVRVRMVHHVQRIHAELEALGLADLDVLTQIRVERP